MSKQTGSLFLRMCRQSDYTDYADYGNDIWDGAGDSGKRQPDYTDYADYGNDTSAASFPEKPVRDDAAIEQRGMKSIKPGQHKLPSKEDHHQQDPAVINGINRNQRNQCNQLHMLEPSLNMRDTLTDEGNQSTGTIPDEVSLQKNRCPHHPRARMVHVDPTGQAWCDRQECWDCFRLMKIGEALKYRRLTERGGKLLIEEGLEGGQPMRERNEPFLSSEPLRRP